MRPPRVTTFGLAVVVFLGVGALAVGTEMQRPVALIDTHAMRSTAASRLVNDPRLAGILSQSAQHVLQYLKGSNNDLFPSPLTRAVPRAGQKYAGPGTWTVANPPLAFNDDQGGFPQNTESVANCSAGGTIVGGYDDFRLAPSGGDLSAWSVSTDSGHSLTNSNFLPGVTVNVVASGPASGPAPPPTPVPSPGASRVVHGGDGGGPSSGGTRRVYVATQGNAVVRATQSCAVYATSLAFGFNQGAAASAVIVDDSNAATLTSCSSEDSCWIKRRVVAIDTTGSAFFDKPTIAVDANTPGTPVYVGFTKFSFDNFGDQTVSVDVVRCDGQLFHCTPPVALETDETYFGGGPRAGAGGGGGAFITPTAVSLGVGSDGTTYASWASLQQPLFGSGQTGMSINFASAPPGKLRFSAPVEVTSVGQPIQQPFASEVTQVSGFPVLAVSHAGSVDRLHIVFGQCRAEALGICEHSESVLASSLKGSAGTWSFEPVGAGANSDFFQTITVDTTTGNLLVGFFTTRFDVAQHRYDVMAVPVDAASGTPSAPIRVTSSPIEPDNDTLSGPFFSGDYFGLTAANGTAWAHYTSTQRLQQLLGQGVPVPQQDNVLTRFTF